MSWECQALLHLASFSKKLVAFGYQSFSVLGTLGFNDTPYLTKARDIPAELACQTYHGSGMKIKRFITVLFS